MATITWPTDLPQRLETSGFEESIGDNVISSPVDRGRPKRRRRYTAAPYPLSGSIRISSAQWDTLKTFHQTTLQSGILEFKFPNPDNIGTMLDAIFTEPPSRSNIGGQRYRARLSLEIQP